jgi:hypothetical protein
MISQKPQKKKTMEINASPPQYIMVMLLKVNPCSSGMSTQLFDVCFCFDSK